MSLSRSCLECRRRKIRCDRKQPCSYCPKVRIECTYPTMEGSSLPQRRRRSDATTPPAAESAARLRVLEEHVQQLEARLFEVEGRPAIARTSSTASRYSSPATSAAIARLSRSADGMSDSSASSGFAFRLSPKHHDTLLEIVDANRARSLWSVYLTDVGKRAPRRLTVALLLKTDSTLRSVTQDCQPSIRRGHAFNISTKYFSNWEGFVACHPVCSSGVQLRGHHGRVPILRSRPGNGHAIGEGPVPAKSHFVTGIGEEFQQKFSSLIVKH
jgi:hypothetical protein